VDLSFLRGHTVFHGLNLGFQVMDDSGVEFDPWSDGR
jgi:hypothetical protein